MAEDTKQTGVDPYLYLKALEEEGIDEIYLNPQDKSTAQASPAVYAPAVQASERLAVRERPASPAKDGGVREQLIGLRDETLKCTLCSELAGSRKNVVFGAGSVKAELMFVGEAPGYDEDIQGLPFVGKAGQLLTKIIEAINLTRNQVFICNVLKCRPPENRQPHPDEVMNCQGYLHRQIDLIRPKVICALGNFAAQTLLKSSSGISQLRGKFFAYQTLSEPAHEIKVMCTYHPAYLLRNPSEKGKVWEDMKLVRDQLKK